MSDERCVHTRFKRGGIQGAAKKIALMDGALLARCHDH